MRVTLLGNAGSGKSTLARKIARHHDLPLVELDQLLWQEGWEQTPDADFAALQEAELLKPRWVIDGMGPLFSLGPRLHRATHVILCDLPLWQNHWLVAERYTAWKMGAMEHPPGGQKTPPSSELVHRFLARVDAEFMPTVRQMVEDARGHAHVTVLPSFEHVRNFNVSALAAR
ncbi:MAG: adenylate kinase [Pseudomonadota bacterium]